MSGGPDEQLAVPRVFPFSALVGQDDLRLALVLCAIDPSIGGALLTGEKGSGKTTAARGLAELLPGAAPFVELPLGAVEERVVGSIDLRAALEQGEHKLQPGLLHTANGGVLYVDEVNLLADHLVDVLLDVAVSGVNRVERDGISHRHLSRFVLVGSMNPEEGQLRPQLLDRFGLSVTVRAPGDPRLRAEAVRRRLAFDADPERFRLQWGEIQRDLRRRLATAQPRPLEPGLDEKVSAICAAAGAEGLRADLVICRAAAALAGWRRSPTTGDDEVRTVAGLALGHRRRAPMERNAPRTELDEVLDGVLGPRPGPRPPTGGSGGPAPTGPDPVSEGPADGHPDRSPPGAASPPPPPPPPPAVVDRPASVPPGLTLGGGAPQGHVDAAPGRHAEGSGHGRR
ncbi:MAG TPA: AAA family ATPase, partial [Acidimicrobiales bacterium]|nr:AAA family ATPase [Acidimicrobiales bacterium]